MKTLFDYIIYSTLIHSMLFFPFANSMPTHKSTTEITVLTTPKSAKNNTHSPNTYTKRNYAKSGKSANLNKSKEIESYKDLAESIVIPRFYEMFHDYYPYPKYNNPTILLIKVGLHGRVLKVTVKQSSGDTGFDNMCTKSIPDNLPEPVPKEILMDGIMWEFSKSGEG